MALSKARASEVQYDVFLSFRGKDIRGSFTDFLYQALKKANVRVFLDEEEIEVDDVIGETILQSTDNSIIYIPIISQTYPDSKWCLTELARMMNNVSISRNRKRIFPIFFEVKLEDLKLKTPPGNNFPIDFWAWKDALAEVAKFKGWKVQKGQRQTHIVNSVVRTVLEKLGKKEESHIEYPIEPYFLTKPVEYSFNQPGEFDDIRRGRSQSRTGPGKRSRSLTIYKRKVMYTEEEYFRITGRRGRSGSRRSSSSSVRGSSGGSRRRSRSSVRGSSSESRRRSRSRVGGSSDRNFLESCFEALITFLMPCVLTRSLNDDETSQ